MFQTLWIRITASAGLTIGCLVLLGCSASERPALDGRASPMPDNSTAPVTQAIDPPAPEPSTAPGMKVFMDPVTGEMRDPTEAERAAMEQSTSKPVGKPRSMREEKLRKRGTAMTLEGDPQTPLQACTNADGSVVVDHECEQTPRPEQQPEGKQP